MKIRLDGMETVYGFTYSKREMTSIVKGFTSRGVFYKARFAEDWSIQTVEEKGKFYVYLSSRKLKINYKYGDAGKFYHKELMSRKIKVKSNANMFSDIKGEYVLTSMGLLGRSEYESIFNKLLKLNNPNFRELKYESGKFYQDSFGRYVYTIPMDEYQSGEINENKFIRKNFCLSNCAVVIDFKTDNDIVLKTLDRKIHPIFIKEIPLNDKLLRIITLTLSNIVNTNIIIDINNPKNNRLVKEKSVRKRYSGDAILKHKDNFIKELEDIL